MVRAALGGSLTFSTAAGAASNVGQYAVTPGGLTSANYAITFQPGTLTIDPAPLTVTAAGVDKIYDGTTTATANLSDNRINGDTLTVGYATASFTDKNVGTARPSPSAASRSPAPAPATTRSKIPPPVPPPPSPRRR